MIFVFSLFIWFISSIRSVLVPVGGTASVDVGRRQILVPLSYNLFNGFIFSGNGSVISVLGERNYILNFSVSSTLYIQSKNQQEATFYYDIFDYENCSAIDIIINPGDGYSVEISPDNADAVPLRDSQKLCLWMLWSPSYQYQFTLTNSGLSIYDPFSYSTDSQSTYTPVLPGEITIDSAQTNGVLRAFVQTDEYRLTGGAAIRASTSNTGNTLHPSLRNLLCVNENPSGETGESCTWLTFERYSQIIDIDQIDIPELPDFSTPFIAVVIAVIVVIIVVVVISCCRNKKCRHRKVNGSNSSSSSSSSNSSQRNHSQRNQRDFHTTNYNPNYDVNKQIPGFPNQQPYYCQTPMYPQYPQYDQSNAQPEENQNQDSPYQNPYYTQDSSPNPYYYNN